MLASSRHRLTGESEKVFDCGGCAVAVRTQLVNLCCCGWVKLEALVEAPQHILKGHFTLNPIREKSEEQQLSVMECSYSTMPAKAYRLLCTLW